MNTYSVYFKPCGSIASWPLASDTLFGAVCWGIRQLGLMDDASLTDWLERNRNTPPFAFSHAYPVYLGRNPPVRLYPLPMIFHPTHADIDLLVEEWQQKHGGTRKVALVKLTDAGKALKRANFISEQLLVEIAAGQHQPKDVLRAMLSNHNRISLVGSVLCTHAEEKILPYRFFQSEAMQHNHIDRMAGATVEGMLYYRDETSFAPKAGLWALLRVEAETFDRYIHPALRYLEDTGLGADRTTGKGHFKISVKLDTEMPRPITPKAMMTLSRYIPQKGEFDIEGSPMGYELKMLTPKREQKFPRPLQSEQQSMPVYKQSVPVFEPGSVFPLGEEKSIYGQLVRLTPEEHDPVFQSGAALMVYL